MDSRPEAWTHVGQPLLWPLGVTGLRRGSAPPHCPPAGPFRRTLPVWVMIWWREGERRGAEGQTCGIWQPDRGMYSTGQPIYGDKRICKHRRAAPGIDHPGRRESGVGVGVECLWVYKLYHSAV